MSDDDLYGDPFSEDLFADDGTLTPRAAYNAGREEDARELLLEEAAGKPVMRLLQIDAMRTDGEGDDVMRPDGDGHCLMAGKTYELRRSGDWLPVRVHVHEDAGRDEALALLRKITAWLERDFDRLMEMGRPPDKPPDDKPRLRRVK